MECPICGHPLGENDAFCENCGNFALPLQNNDRSVPLIQTPPGTPTEGTTQVPAPKDSASAPANRPPRKVAERLYPPPDADLEEHEPISADPDPVPAESAHAAHPAAEKRPAQRPASAHTEPPKEPRSSRVWKVVAGIACCLALLSIAIAVYIVVTTAGLQVQLNKAQKENSTAQANAQDLEAQVASLTDSLSASETERESLGEQVAELQSQINGMEGSVNQSEYDKENAQRQLDEINTQLKEANTQLEAAQSENTDLQQQLKDSQDALSDAESENETLTTENEALQEQMKDYEAEAEFIDEYVVFVIINNADRYYHKYSCPNFTQRNFLAYSVRLAESNGYTPCPVCHDGVVQTDEDEPGGLAGLFGNLP